MKSYILKLLAQSDSEAAKLLTSVITMSDTVYSYDLVVDCFSFFISHTLENDKLFQSFHNYSNKGKQVIEGTPVCWRIRDDCFVSIWLE